MISRRFSLTFAIVTTLACLLMLTWILLSLISFKTAEQSLRQQKVEESRLLAATIAASFPVPLTSADVAVTMARLSAELRSEHGVIGVTVMDRERRILTGGDADRLLDAIIREKGETFQFSHGGRQLHRYVPIQQEGRLVGGVRLSLSLAAEYERLNRSRSLLIAYFVLDFILLLVIGSWLVARVVIVPIRKLLVATERVAAGDFNQGVKVPGGAEIADLAQSFNSMVAALRSKREEADRHVASLEEMNRELQLAREETIRSEKMASVGVLAAGMAHEIGTPLSSILGYAEILQGEAVPGSDQADCLRRIEQEARKIDRLVRELLDFSRPMPADREMIELGPFVADLLEMLSRQGVLKQIEIQTSIAADLPPVFLDRQHLQQVLLNLLLNARDAMAGGGKLLLVLEQSEFSASEAWGTKGGGPTMGRRREDFGGLFSRPFPVEGAAGVPCVRITIGDTGSGIGVEQLPRIFDPFFTTKEPGRGTGLGLAIVARLVDSFGGRITVESTVGQGTRFQIWLPLGQDEEMA